MEEKKDSKFDGALNGFSSVSSTRIFWKSRKRSANGRNLDKVNVDNANGKPNQQEESVEDTAKGLPDEHGQSANEENMLETDIVPELSERRKALFEPLDPVVNVNGKRASTELLLPPPDFDSASYPKGWLIGKKRKLVNVDVVESMRRIAVQEMNRKDREINGLNEQLEEDSRCLEHLQVQLLEERSKRTQVERENAMLQDQISMLMNMLQENEPMDDEGVEDETHDAP